MDECPTRVNRPNQLVSLYRTLQMSSPRVEVDPVRTSRFSMLVAHQPMTKRLKLAR
jgi:hypothetical protein